MRVELLRGRRRRPGVGAEATDGDGGGRAAGELLGAGAALAPARERAEREVPERECAAGQERLTRANRERCRALAAEGVIEEVMGSRRRVKALVAQTKPSACDEAVALLVDLQVIAVEPGSAQESSRRVGQLRADHARKPNLSAASSAPGS